MLPSSKLEEKNNILIERGVNASPEVSASHSLLIICGPFRGTWGARIIRYVFYFVCSLFCSFIFNLVAFILCSFRFVFFCVCVSFMFVFLYFLIFYDCVRFFFLSPPHLFIFPFLFTHNISQVLWHCSLDFIVNIS